MSFVTVAPAALATAVTELTKIGSAIYAADTAMTASAMGIAAAGTDEVSA
ncbi:PE family protein, partial [Thiocapsa sp.]